jgi:uncharacterized membrane protein YqjE
MSGKSGILYRFRHFCGNLAEAARDRLSLFANEVEEAHILIVDSFLRALLAYFCLMMALVLTTLFLILAFPEHQLLIAALLAALFFIAAFSLGFASRSALSRKKFFAASIAELDEDIRALRGEPATSDAPKTSQPL